MVNTKLASKKNQTKMQQVHLERVGGDNAFMVTWLDCDPRLKVGLQVQLKGDDKSWWKIIEIYSVIQTRDQVEFNRNFDNNNYDKHDGTALKDRIKK